MGCRTVVKWIREKCGVGRLNAAGSRCGSVPGLGRDSRKDTNFRTAVCYLLPILPAVRHIYQSDAGQVTSDPAE